MIPLLLILFDVTNIIEQNLSINIENIFIIITACGCLVTAAKDPKIAIMVGVLLFMSEFIVFYEMSSLSWLYALVAFLISLILLPLSLLMPDVNAGRMV